MYCTAIVQIEKVKFLGIALTINNLCCNDNLTSKLRHYVAVQTLTAHIPLDNFLLTDNLYVDMSSYMSSHAPLK